MQRTVDQDPETREQARRQGRLINRSPALARQRESIQQRQRSSISDWTTSMDAPPEQLDAFDEAVGGLHDAVAVGNHSVWGDPLPPHLARPVQLSPAAAPTHSTAAGGAASANASYAAPARAPGRARCPEVNANFERALAQSNLRHSLDDLLRLPPGGTGDQVALRDERGQTHIVSREAALASRRRVEAELRTRVGHVEADLAGLREMLASLRANNQDATNPFDFPAAERQLTALERRLAELRARLAERTAEAWSQLAAMLDAAGESARAVHGFITDHIVDDTGGAELAQAGLRAVRNTALAVFTVAAIASTGGAAGVALAGAAGATFEAAEQVSEVGHQQRREVSGAEIGAAGLYAAVDAALQVLTGTRAASGLALLIMQRAERLLLGAGVSAAVARTLSRQVAQTALGQLASRLRGAADAGVQRATGVSRRRDGGGDVQSSSSTLERYARQPGTSAQRDGLLPSWTPAFIVSKLDEQGLDARLESAAQDAVRGLAGQSRAADRARMRTLGASGAVSRAEAARSIGGAPVQMRRQGRPSTDVHAAAAEGTRGAPSALPFAAQIQRAFGRHDVSHVAAHLDGAAKKASAAMGARAFATGHHVAFGEAPDLHTAAHEAAHIVQQRAGVQLSGGVGEAGDRHERHADEVAARVVAGRSAEDLLDAYAPSAGASSGVQRRAVQMWSEQEHRAIGNRASDLVMPRGAVSVPVRGGALSFGAAARSGGDYAATPDELDAQGARLEANERSNAYRPTNTPAQAAREAARSSLPLPGAADAAGRVDDFLGMASIGGTNVNHFFPLCQNEHRAHHRAAMEAARTGDNRRAMREEGFAAHFLMDSFAAGHQTPRALDRIHEQDIRATATPNPAHTEEGLGLMRAKPFHDALNELRAGIPLRGIGRRFHGDDTMTDDDRDYIAEQVAISLGEVLRALGTPGLTAPAGPLNVPSGPDGPAILRDSSQRAAQRIWRLLTRTYERDLSSAEQRPSEASLRSDGGTQSNTRETAAAMRGALYGGQGATPGPAFPREVPRPTGSEAAPRTTDAVIAGNRRWHRAHPIASNPHEEPPAPEPPRTAGVETDASE